MSKIKDSYAKDLDLNLLRVFVVVAEEGSITRAAARLYVTQPAVSASMRRLGELLGGEVFTRQGRGLALTHRGEKILAVAREHLGPLVDVMRAEPPFDAKASTATIRLGVGDGMDAILLPPLLARLRRTAPRMRLIVVVVNFRNVEELLLAGKVDVALSVADELPRSIHREQLVDGTKADYVCLYDHRHVKLPRKVTDAQYFALEHVAVSFAGDARGIVEDELGRSRDIRVCVPGFSAIGAVVEGSPLVATLPAELARHLRKTHPHLRTARLSFTLEGACLDLLWSRVKDGDDAHAFVRDELRDVVREVVASLA